MAPGTASAAAVTDTRWQPKAGDEVLVDTATSIVYLLHQDGTYLALDALTGQHRNVAYDGIYYNARTPERVWEIRGFERKGRSVTFGNGRFGRLWWPGKIDLRRGDEGTAYGFHSHLSFARMLDDKKNKTAWDPEGTGFRSMGCILLSEEDLTLIENLVSANNGVLRVETRYGVDIAQVSQDLARRHDRAPQWFGIRSLQNDRDRGVVVD